MMLALEGEFFSNGHDIFLGRTRGHLLRFAIGARDRHLVFLFTKEILCSQVFDSASLLESVGV